MTPPKWTISDFIHTGPWWKNRGILLLNLWLIVPLMSSSVNGLNSSLVNGLQIIPAWQEYYNYPEGKTLGLINSAQSIGCLIGLPFSPYISDGIGRRSTLFLGSLIMLVGVSLQTFAVNVSIFVAARIILGVGLELCSNSAPLLILELSYPTQRGKITSTFNSCWYLGSIISAWVCFGSYDHAKDSIWSFRVPTMVQAIMPFLQVCLIWFTPESPRFLVSKGYEGKAAAVLAKYHANGGSEQDPLVVFEMAQIRHAIRMEEEINRTTSFRTLVATPGNRKRMRLILAIAVFSQWSGNGLVSYYINLVLEGVGVTNTETKAFINGGLQVYNYVIAIGAALLVDWVGRRKLFITSNSAFSSWTITTALYVNFDNTAAARATIPLIFIFYFFYDIAYTPLLVAYSLEILPYKIRAKGFAVMNLTVMATIAFNQFINPVAIDAIGWWYYLVYCGWLIFELGFIIAFVVETKGRTLEETSVLFDGEQQPDDLMIMGGEAAAMTASSTFVDLDQKYSSTGEESYELRLKPRQHRDPTFYF
ncbi:general substrate transporter [Collybia nuda]|uniref:General substrate transporter n=1 Tax=Collybia nuda TaxID=64659 RepID=A0A9P5XWC7_9AGAR|nr:general substrate transporter [Collybia nuda]